MHFWEDAVKGSSALQAALNRRLLDETAVALGLVTASTYWDLAKFYDSIDWVRAIKWAIELKFPCALLRVVISLHMAPRVVRVGKMCSSIIQPHNSVVAGCSSAIWLSRVMVCTILAEVHLEGPIKSRNFFDDITSRCTHEDPEDVVAELSKHSVRLGQTIIKSRLGINESKTIVVGTTKALGKKVVKTIGKKSNINLRVGTSTRDLGVDAAGGVEEARLFSGGGSEKPYTG